MSWSVSVDRFRAIVRELRTPAARLVEAAWGGRGMLRPHGGMVVGSSGRQRPSLPRVGIGARVPIQPFVILRLHKGPPDLLIPICRSAANFYCAACHPNLESSSLVMVTILSGIASC